MIATLRDLFRGVLSFCRKAIISSFLWFYSTVIRKVILSSAWNILLPFTIAAFVTQNRNVHPALPFVFSFLGLLPAANFLGQSMESIAARIHPVRGFFLRVFSGNLVELISGGIAVNQCQIDLVQTTLIGSILMNILCCLGLSFIVGGIKFREQEYRKTSSNMALLPVLFFSVVVSLFAGYNPITSTTASDEGVQPAALDPAMGSHLLRIGRGAAVLMLVGYCGITIFNLRTHTFIFSEGLRHFDRDDNDRLVEVDCVATFHSDDSSNKESANKMIPALKSHDPKHDSGLSLISSVILAATSLTLITLLSDYLVAGLISLAEHARVSIPWIGFVLVPFAGTLSRADLMEVISHGLHNRQDASILMTVGSSVNLALFVQPILVIAGWALGKPLSLLFDTLQTLFFWLSVALVSNVIRKGKSNYMDGMCLFMVYIIMATFEWFYNPGDDVGYLC